VGGVREEGGGENDWKEKYKESQDKAEEAAGQKMIEAGWGGRRGSGSRQQTRKKGEPRMTQREGQHIRHPKNAGREHRGGGGRRRV